MAVVSENNSASKKTIIEKTEIKGIVMENALSKLVKDKILVLENRDGEKFFTVAPENPKKETTEEKKGEEVNATPIASGKKKGKKEKAVAKTSDEGEAKENSSDKKGKIDSSRDMRRFRFLGKEHTKGGLVHAVISEFVRKHKNISVGKLKETFPDELLQRFGVFQIVKDAKTFTSGGRDRFFLKSGQILKLKDGSIAICNQWTASNIAPFLKVARKHFDIR